MSKLSPSGVFNYELPDERIAQRPVYPYSDAKLLSVDRNSGDLRDSTFNSIAEFLNPNDLLVFNNTRVRASRIFGKLRTGAAVELLVLKELSTGSFECMGRPLKKLNLGTEIELEGGLKAVAGTRKEDTKIEVDIFLGDKPASLEEIDRLALMPIPPYIRKGYADTKDREDYQTHFAENTGSVAAPTASLHFTPELVSKIKAKGCRVEFLTLHVGPPSFLSLWKEGDEFIEGPGTEAFISDLELVDKCRAVKDNGGRVIAVGTTAVRALESMVRVEASGELKTDLFISPGFDFKLVDVMITNFHLPKSSHLLLVEAFCGRELLAKSYNYALDLEYRFLSYGDGMILV
ncbi:MAG: tRNA preQ1(34) S-adenosylmethionine ribosyltransferase-isomerase QueA [Bdellovibrionota bacterium]